MIRIDRRKPVRSLLILHFDRPKELLSGIYCAMVCRMLDAANSKIRSEPRLHALLVVCLFAFLCAGVFSPLLLAGRSLVVHETLLQFWPAFFGERTTWTTRLFSGYPLMGDPQTMMWYPLSLVFSYFGWWNAFVLTAYVLAGSFTYGYLYSLTSSRFAAFAGGTLYSLSGFFLIRLVHTNIIHSAAWLPLLIWSLEMQRRRESRSWMVITAIAVGCGALAGHPQIWVYSLTLAGLYALTMAPACPAGAWRFLRSSLIGVVLGAGLAGILFVPMMELTRESLRSEITPQYAVTFSLSFAQLPLLLFPLLSSDPSQGPALQFPWFEVTGYVGLLSIALACIGLVQTCRERVARFWFVASIIAVLLALGASTPIGRLAFLIPVYNTFRAPGRHLLEFTFAVSVLAAFGIASLERMPTEKRVRSVLVACIGLCLVLSCVAVFLSTSEKLLVLLLPYAVLLVSAPILYLWARSPSTARATLLLVVMVLDCAHVGYFLVLQDVRFRQWDLSKPEYLTKYQNILNRSWQRLSPLRAAEQPLEAAPPNLSRLWGIANVGGYNPLILRRYSELSNMTSFGRILYHSLDPRDRGLDILSLRYLLASKSFLDGSWDFERLGLGWRNDDLEIELGSGCGPRNPTSVSFRLPAVESTEIGVVSSLSCSVGVLDKSNVLKLNVIGADNSIQTFFIKASIDTSEWAIDRADVHSVISHGRAEVFESFPSVDERGAAFEGHHFASIVALPPTAIRELRLEWAGRAGTISLQKISLGNKLARRSYAINREADYLADSTRWRHDGTFGETSVYENLRAMPRAWLVSRAVTLSPSEVLRTIRESTLPDGTAYNPSEVALVENPLTLNSQKDTERTASIVSESETRIDLRTHSREPAFLVLSDTYYQGWQATVDGRPVTIYRSNYVSRGVALPSGDHVVTFSFRPVSFTVGLVISLLAFLFIVGLLVTKPRSSGNT